MLYFCSNIIDFENYRLSSRPNLFTSILQILGKIFALVCDSITKLPEFIKVIKAKINNAFDIMRNLRIEVYIFIPGKAATELILF